MPSTTDRQAEQIKKHDPIISYVQETCFKCNSKGKQYKKIEKDISRKH